MVSFISSYSSQSSSSIAGLTTLWRDSRHNIRDGFFSTLQKWKCDLFLSHLKIYEQKGMSEGDRGGKGKPFFVRGNDCVQYTSERNTQDQTISPFILIFTIWTTVSSISNCPLLSRLTFWSANFSPQNSKRFHSNI